MRGRATSVVLPALAVLALVALVAIAATGSTPGGTEATRPPSESLLDTLFSLGLVAVGVGAIVLLYGLAQRKAIAREVASGRYRRTTLWGWLAFVVLFMGFTYWRLTRWEPPTAGENGELAFPGRLPTEPTVTDPTQPAPYEPSISWLPIALVVGLVLAAAIAYSVAERRARSGRQARVALVEQLAAALDESLDDLRAEADPRKAIIAAYARLERVLAANGVPRRPSETPDEYVPRVLEGLDLDPDAIARLTSLFKRAKFSQHDVDTAMKEEAIDALQQARDELRLAREATAPAEPPPRAIEARS